LKVTAEEIPLDEDEEDVPLPDPLWLVPAPLDPLTLDPLPDPDDDVGLAEADDWLDELDCERDGSIAPRLGKISLVIRSNIDRARVLASIISRPELVTRICVLIEA